jgi:hypothetical protein
MAIDDNRCSIDDTGRQETSLVAAGMEPGGKDQAWQRSLSARTLGEKLIGQELPD